MHDVLVARKRPVRRVRLAALDVARLLQLHDRGPDGVLALLADMGEALERVIPVVRQTQDLAQ